MCVVRTTGNLCFVTCVPSAWGLHEARAHQLEAQSVEGVHYSVVGGRPDPRRHPNHLPLALSSDQDVVPDSSALPNPLDTYGGGLRGERGDWRGAGGEEGLTEGRTDRREVPMTRQQKQQRAQARCQLQGEIMKMDRAEGRRWGVE